MRPGLPAIVPDHVDQCPSRLYPNAIVAAIDVERNVHFFRHCAPAGSSVRPFRRLQAAEATISGLFWPKLRVQATQQAIEPRKSEQPTIAHCVMLVTYAAAAMI
jgi:hypothetical protein